jgi:3-phosphoglycerate kinase
MSQPILVSPEVIARVQSEQLRLIILLSELQRVAKARHDERLDQVVAPLVESLRRHMGLVDGVLDALVPDAIAADSQGQRCSG